MTGSESEPSIIKSMFSQEISLVCHDAGKKLYAYISWLKLKRLIGFKKFLNKLFKNDLE